MSINPKVSVIIATYNRARFICGAIESVLGQTYKDIELIVVDDGSTDNTGELLGRYKNKFRYVYQHNQEKSAARNKGISLATGEYVAFLDSDDVWFHDKLARQVPVLEKASADVVLVHGYKQIVDENLRPIDDANKKLCKLYRPAERNAETYLAYLKASCIFTSTVLIRRKTLLEVGGYDPNLIDREDYELYLRILLKGYRFAFISKPPLTQYRLDTKRTDQKRIDEGYLALYQKHLNLCAQLNDGKKINKAKRLLYQNIAQTHYRLGNFDKAKKFWDKALNSSWLTLADLHFWKQRLF